jgi:hypothetical protein
MSRRLTDLQLERFLADAMSAPERAQVDAALTQSPEDAEALRLMRSDSAALLFKLPPAAFVEKVMPTPRTSSFRAWWAAVAAVAATLLAVVVWRGQQPDDEVRVKGAVAWKVTASGQSGVRTLSAKDAVAAGETLSFQVTAARPVYAAVISHAPDGWFVYSPAVQVERGQSMLATAALLDASVGDETLYLVTSEQPFDAAAVKDRLSTAAAPGVTLESLPIRKK